MNSSIERTAAQHSTQRLMQKILQKSLRAGSCHATSHAAVGWQARISNHSHLQPLILRVLRGRHDSEVRC